ncbi:MAG: glycosyltransferase 87 family protein [Lachnospiraceae bacterium]|nr:glycosyltransferase 87 family protein [Lachnospiraceae bacterium]
MLSFERKAIKYLKENAVTVFLLFVTLGGILGRIFLWDIVSSDMAVYLKWYKRAEECGGLPGLYALGQRIKGYNALFQLLISILVHIPGEPLYKMKLTWMLFDLLLAAGLGRLVRENCGAEEQKAKIFGALAYGACFLSMNVIFNSAAWGQSDSVYVSLIIWSLVWLLRGRHLKAFLLLGTAFAFKLQTVFILPFYFYYYLSEQSFSCLYFLTVPGVFALSALPRQLVRLLSPIRAEAAVETFSSAAPVKLSGLIDVYIGQIASGGQMCIEYPGFWSFLPNSLPEAGGFEDFYKFRLTAVLFAGLVLLALIFLFLRRGGKKSREEYLFAAFLLSFTTVYFLPCMIDRYGYLYEVLALALVFADKRTMLPALGLLLTIIYHYAGRVGMESLPITLPQLSLIMLLLYGVYLVLFLSRGKEEKDAGI